MFSDEKRSRIFGVPPGIDFAATVARDLRGRFQAMSPEEVARVQLLTNTRRLSRRMRDEFQTSQATLLPRIGEVSDLGRLAGGLQERARSGLARELELMRLIKPFVEGGLSPTSSVPGLAQSLAELLDEMGGEGVPLSAFDSLETGDVSGHWAQSVSFLKILSVYAETVGETSVGPEAARRATVERLIARWSDNAPTHPVVIIGSTASRDTTALLMEAVCRLPEGAIYLPGLDFELPDRDWQLLTEGQGCVDHPQYRLAAFLLRIGMDRHDVVRLGGELSPHNSLISLSLRPAPVTDRWLDEGPALGDLVDKTKRLSLIEAPSQRIEATAIACAVRRALEDGKSVSLITPDRTVARRVSAHLRRWGVVADDSAGRPLGLTAPGRLLRMVAASLGAPPSPVRLLEILSHPIVNATDETRGEHLRLTRELELWLRRNPQASVTEEVLIKFAEARKVDDAWLTWLTTVLGRMSDPVRGPMSDMAVTHSEITVSLASGPAGHGAGTLWDEAAGREAYRTMERLHLEGHGADHIDYRDYIRILEGLFTQASVRSDEDPRSDVTIWGALEARAQGAEVIILAGLNEGIWPQAASPDPWLNRALRRQIGLPLSDREIGLSAHDYQQAASASEVILCRSLRDAEAESVPSRWLSRLFSLLGGLPEQGGPTALKAMKDRGRRLVSDALTLDKPRKTVPRASRPAPAPPVEARPRTLSVTDIQKLIRDPYAIYAKRVLRLNRLDPLNATPSAALRGTVLHKVMEMSLNDRADRSDAAALSELIAQIGQAHIDSTVPWAAFGAQLRGHIAAIAERLGHAEQLRSESGAIFKTEAKGAYRDGPGDIVLKGTLDRIDRLADGTYGLYDYKTGAIPNAKEIAHFDRQLPIEAMMVEAGAFEDIPRGRVSIAAHIALGRSGGTRPDLDLSPGADPDLSVETIKAELSKLLASYMSPTRGYVARRAIKSKRFEGDYDHLSRHGEWDESEPPTTDRFE